MLGSRSREMTAVSLFMFCMRLFLDRCIIATWMSVRLGLAGDNGIVWYDGGTEGNVVLVLGVRFQREPAPSPG